MADGKVDERAGRMGHADDARESLVRWQCLARYVLNIPHFHARRDFLKHFEENNGKESRKRLEKLMGAERERRDREHGPR